MSPCSGPLLSDEESIRKYNDEKQWGLHIAIDLGECDHAKISDGDYIRRFAVDLADHIHMKRYGEPIAVRFGAEPKVEGYSLIQLIETSCIAGHFAEDTDRAFIDTSGEVMDLTGNVEMRYVDRDLSISCHHLIFDTKAMTVECDSAVDLSFDDGTMTGESLSGDLRSMRIEIGRSVQGVVGI